jgi:hypothetical protein
MEVSRFGRGRGQRTEEGSKAGPPGRSVRLRRAIVTGSRWATGRPRSTIRTGEPLLRPSIRALEPTLGLSLVNQ